MNNMFLGALLMMAMALQACSNNVEPPTPSEVAEAIQVDSIPKEVPIEPASEEQPARRTVLDYYQMLTSQGLLTYEYPLQEQQGRWVCISPLTEESFEAVVDVPNGFIELEDDGTGGGTYRRQVVLFRMEDSKAVIGVNELIHDGVTLSHNYAFYRDQNGRLEDWTERTMPAISGFDFLPSDYAEESDIVAQALDVYFELPRKGTKLTCKVWTGKKVYFCQEDANEEDQIACAVINRVIRESFKLDWNRQEGRFN